MVIPLIQSSETSAAIALNKINDEIAHKYEFKIEFEII